MKHPDFHKKNNPDVLEWRRVNMKGGPQNGGQQLPLDHMPLEENCFELFSFKGIYFEDTPSCTCETEILTSDGSHQVNQRLLSYNDHLK